MAICPEFLSFREDPIGSENAFVQKFLIPLLSRFGFEIVKNYHGSREHGRDLIFGEIDRFADIRYYALQAKFEPSISNNAMTANNGLISDCRQAFMTDFQNPNTGVPSRISAFYAVNAGSISDAAHELFFSVLRQEFHDNVRLIDGRGLLALDRMAAIAYGENRRDILTGLFQECRLNAISMTVMLLALKDIAYNDDSAMQAPHSRLRLNALEAYFTRPLAELKLSAIDMNNLWNMSNLVNSRLDAISTINARQVIKRVAAQEAIVWLETFIPQLIDKLQAAVESALQGLGPVARF
jgi:hypothetical protein